MAGGKESIGHGALDLSRYVDGLAVGDGEAAGCDLCKGVCSTAQSKSRVARHYCCRLLGRLGLMFVIFLVVFLASGGKEILLVG